MPALSRLRVRRPRVLLPMLLVSAVLATLGIAPPAGAQESLLTQVYPEAATLGLPDGIGVGSQLTWYTAGASVAQSRYQWVEDPDGTWTDPATGKRYRRTDEPDANGNVEGTGAGAGDGLVVVDLVAVEGPDAVVSVTALGIDRLGGTFTLAPFGGGKVPGAVLDGGWMHPALLERMAKEGYSGFQVLTGSYPLAGRTYDAVSLVSDAPGSYQSWTWDRATGLLLVSTTRQDGATSPFRAPGDTAPQANSFLGYRQLAGVRQRAIPGLGTPVPDWVARSKGLDYAGTYTFVNPMGGADPMVFGYTTTADFSPGGPTWANVKFQNVVDFQGYPQKSEGTAIASGTGSYWWDPDALAAMKRGQQLDRDPLTNTVTTVEDVVPWPGGTSVIIRTELPGNRIRSQFDVATGVMLGTEVYQQSQGTTIGYALQRMP